jgi:hypothetical protein
MSTTHQHGVPHHDAAAALDLDLTDVPMDVFDLADSGLSVQSLTAGHGMVETAASAGCCPSFTSCS